LRLAAGDPLGDHLLVKIHGAMIEAASDANEAASVAHEGERALAGSEVCEQCSMSFRIAAANAFARAGDVPSARRHLDEAARISEMWQGGAWPAAVHEGRGNLELALGNRRQAEAEFTVAAAMFERASRPLDATRCRTSPSSR
jgi:hypothetical protein